MISSPTQISHFHGAAPRFSTFPNANCLVYCDPFPEMHEFNFYYFFSNSSVSFDLFASALFMFSDLSNAIESDSSWNETVKTTKREWARNITLGVSRKGIVFIHFIYVKHYSFITDSENRFPHVPGVKRLYCSIMTLVSSLLTVWLFSLCFSFFPSCLPNLLVWVPVELLVRFEIASSDFYRKSSNSLRAIPVLHTHLHLFKELEKKNNETLLQNDFCICSALNSEAANQQVQQTKMRKNTDSLPAQPNFKSLLISVIESCEQILWNRDK